MARCEQQRAAGLEQKAHSRRLLTRRPGSCRQVINLLARSFRTPKAVPRIPLLIDERLTESLSQPTDSWRNYPVPADLGSCGPSGGRAAVPAALGAPSPALQPGRRVMKDSCLLGTDARSHMNQHRVIGSHGPLVLWWESVSRVELSAQLDHK